VTPPAISADLASQEQMPMIPAASHLRLNTSVLAGVEKRSLVWIASRLPGWVNSDHLTALAAFAMVAAGAAFWAASAWSPALLLVVLALIVNWFGDSLDGTLARVRHHERPRYGFYVDHVLDIVGITVLVGGIALSGFMTPVVALTLLIAYLLVSGEVFLATAVNGQFRMSFFGFGPTELRIVLSAGAIRLLGGGSVNPFGLGEVLLFDIGGVVAICGLAIALITNATRTTIALYKAEPLPLDATRSGAVDAIRRSA
jgi:archaetidylinositol phosphate synthase